MTPDTNRIDRRTLVCLLLLSLAYLLLSLAYLVVGRVCGPDPGPDPVGVPASASGRE
jgi:hypothetical protein